MLCESCTLRPLRAVPISATRLNEAAEHGHSTIVRLLFEEMRDGLEVFAMSPGPMLFAMRGGHDHIVQQL